MRFTPGQLVEHEWRRDVTAVITYEPADWPRAAAVIWASGQRASVADVLSAASSRTILAAGHVAAERQRAPYPKPASAELQNLRSETAGL